MGQITSKIPVYSRPPPEGQDFSGEFGADLHPLSCSMHRQALQDGEPQGSGMDAGS
ncbi:hypothetical protein [Synechococcus sp. CS-205]|uniref:hypothetical protein n=1 Tax=Synechococcus sp. CS-205 TaxID=2847984 RepID=UPI00223AE683|nr:hypothetical protein [Synechococcus sp. CS-205]MCT0247599.1 hypothetical protein [Synechococcus sp. CS-205]